MGRLVGWIAAALVCVVARPGWAQGSSSAYTELADSACRLLREDAESESSSWRCGGHAGWRIERHEGDLRASIDLLTPAGVRQPLEFWTWATPAFSALGPRAEWRSRRGEDGKQRPYALVVRMRAYDAPDATARPRSLLVVSKVSPRLSCVVAVVDPGPRQNQRARELADRSAAMPCRSGRR